MTDMDDDDEFVPPTKKPKLGNLPSTSSSLDKVGNINNIYNFLAIPVFVDFDSTFRSSHPNSLRSRCRISVPIECLLKTKFLRIFMIRRKYIYQVAYQNVAANILN